jgi:hypothetical protein
MKFEQNVEKQHNRKENILKQSENTVQITPISLYDYEHTLHLHPGKYF